MILKRVVVGALQENCYIAARDPGAAALVVDPGDEVDTILAALEESDLTVGAIACTHGHGDHIGAVGPLRRATGAPFLIHPQEMEVMERFFDRPLPWLGRTIERIEPDGPLLGGSSIEVDGLRFGVIETPGHTPGAVSLEGHGLVFTGDTLFRGTIGRTDFPGGDADAIARSIMDRLMTLDRETLVLPGHGAETTIGAEWERKSVRTGVAEPGLRPPHLSPARAPMPCPGFVSILRGSGMDTAEPAGRGSAPASGRAAASGR